MRNGVIKEPKTLDDIVEALIRLRQSLARLRAILIIVVLIFMASTGFTLHIQKSDRVRQIAAQAEATEKACLQRSAADKQIWREAVNAAIPMRPDVPAEVRQARIDRIIRVIDTAIDRVECDKIAKPKTKPGSAFERALASVRRGLRTIFSDDGLFTLPVPDRPPGSEVVASPDRDGRRPVSRPGGDGRPGQVPDTGEDGNDAPGATRTPQTASVTCDGTVNVCDVIDLGDVQVGLINGDVTVIEILEGSNVTLIEIAEGGIKVIEVQDDFIDRACFLPGSCP